MSQTIVERTADAIADSVHQASRSTGVITEAIEDGVGMVRHAAKQGCDAAEEFVNDTVHRLQRHLALTIASTLAIGITVGAIFGWMMKRR